jgi:hypothetical protein
MALVHFSPSAVVNCSTLGIHPMANPFAIANLGGNLFLVMFGYIPLKQQEHVEYQFDFSLGMGTVTNLSSFHH